ncbi:MAG: transcriptional repressor [Staphylococcus sp.]|nr:transcriptional repressor [Staphylococcus sp.]
MQTSSITTQQLLDILSEGGVKPSAQRMMILRYLMENRIHPTVDEIFKALQPANPTLSRTTVYNTLRLLTAAGIIRCIGTGNNEGARWDYSTYDHSHFLCISCGHVADVAFSIRPDDFPTRPEGYDINTADVIFKGLCPHCAATSHQA